MRMFVYPRTHALVTAHTPRDLADIVIGYIRPPPYPSMTEMEHDEPGEYEMYAEIPGESIEDRFRIVCMNGHAATIELLISRGANNWNWGLYGVCLAGDMELVQKMIDRGGNDWNLALIGACHSGNIKIAELILDLGADNLERGLCCACMRGFIDIAKLMIARGARNCRWCRKPLAEHK